MKKKIFIMLIPLLFTSIIIEAGDPPGDSPVALVKKIIKDVTYKKAGQSDWELAKTGLPLNDQEQIKTGSKSLALVLFTDGSGLLRVRENCVLNIYGTKDGKKVNKNTFIQKGTLGFEINKQEDEEFKFTTPTAVASIRGTGGLISTDSSSTTISLDSGTVYVESPNDPNRNGTVTGGNTLTMDRGGNVNLRTNTLGDNQLLRNVRQTTMKKVKVKTPYGDIEIEFFQ